MTEDECREQNGDAHEAHMALNGECPWCGSADESQVDFGALVATSPSGSTTRLSRRPLRWK